MGMCLISKLLMSKTSMVGRSIGIPSCVLYKIQFELLHKSSFPSLSSPPKMGFSGEGPKYPILVIGAYRLTVNKDWCFRCLTCLVVCHRAPYIELLHTLSTTGLAGPGSNIYYLHCDNLDNKMVWNLWFVESQMFLFFILAKPIVSKIKTCRLHRDDFETLKIIGRGAFGEVRMLPSTYTSMYF